ncbi:MAG TPA: hypothetical protein VGK20_14500 [Candidatus Binatia bacterium]
MFLRWLFSVFPFEMRQGWALVRPDLLLWLALSALIAVAALSMPAPSDEPPPLLPFLVTVVSGLVTSMLPAVLFTAQLEGRQLTWPPVIALMARRVFPLVVYAIVAISIAWGAETAMLLAMTAALGNSPILIPASTAAGVVILVSILVRFSFLSFLVILLERDRIPPALWQWQRWPWLAPLAWPLTASSRLTENNRWRLVFYTLLGQALPVAAALSPREYLLPASMLATIVLTTVQAAIFLHYRRRCAETGVPEPRLPIEEALTT